MLLEGTCRSSQGLSSVARMYLPTIPALPVWVTTGQLLAYFLTAPWPWYSANYCACWWVEAGIFNKAWRRRRSCPMKIHSPGLFTPVARGIGGRKLWRFGIRPRPRPSCFQFVPCMQEMIVVHIQQNLPYVSGMFRSCKRHL